MKQAIEKLVEEGLRTVGAEGARFSVEHPANLAFGDYSTNAGIVSKKPDELLSYLEKNKPEEVERIELKAGFINFYLSKDFFKKSVGQIIEKGGEFGKNENLSGQKIIVEHTDPNPFKIFHIGHLMPNVIGSTIARLLEWNGALVKQANYQGDAGMHVAKAVWAMMNGSNTSDAYAVGHKAFEESEDTKKEIQEINKKIYEKSDPAVLEVYERGRKESLDYFEKIYKKLGTKFDFYFFESEVADRGKKIVEENPQIFEDSEGAKVFKGERFDPKLHTRVFVNSEGLPTYEAKELGLAPAKYERYPYDLSVVVTANEINEYFKVLLAAMGQVFPDLADKTKHVSHGMLRLPTGKMSSRTGDVVAAEDLISEVAKKTEGNEEVAVGAIKYMILRQSIGGDIVFDFEKSVSTEGDSGVYLQYAYARTNSLLEKATSQGVTLVSGQGSTLSGEVRAVEKLLYRFPEVVERACVEYAPNHITTYLTELAAAYNNFYAHEQVISDDPESPYRLAITAAFNAVMKNGLNILGIPTPERI